MENNTKSKFKFSSHQKVNKEEKTDLKEKENFNIEELKQYYAEFKTRSNKIEEEFKTFDLRLANENHSKEENLKVLEEIGTYIKELKEDYKNNASFLVGYDKQNYMNMLDDLSRSYEVRKEKIYPKKKFAFSNKANINKQNVNQENENTSNKTDVVHIQEAANDFIIKDKSNVEKLILKKEEIGDKNNLIIENISNCEIYILHNFKACYLKDISHSKIFIGSVSGGTHITNCSSSFIYLATHQLRIHQTTNTAFFIISNSNPIIENCSELIFSPLNITYPTLEENLENSKIDVSKNKWNAVLDFKWHKKGKSPNFEYQEESNEIKLNI